MSNKGKEFSVSPDSEQRLTVQPGQNEKGEWTTAKGRLGVISPEGKFYAFRPGEEAITENGIVVGVKTSIKDWLENRQPES